MKKITLLLLALPLSILAQDAFSLLDKSEMETSILYDRAFKVVDLNDDIKKINATYFIQAYSELAQSDYSNYFKKGKSFGEIRTQSFQENIIPIGLINVRFDQLKPHVFEEETVIVNGNKLINTSNDNAIFETKSRVFASPLVPRYRGLNTIFKFDPEYLFNSATYDVVNIQVDFDNDDGVQNVSLNQNVRVTYLQAGEKELKFEITMSSGRTVSHSAYIIIEKSSEDMNASRAPGDESPITPINASIAYQGFGEALALIGTGEYKIYYDNVDGILDKPIFFIDGFDPDDARTIPLMYEQLNFGNPVQNLAELVRDEGFDLVLVNFPNYTSITDGTTMIDGGADFIQRNAFILVELLNTINSMKVGDEENVVIGPSMGGLISRYALRYMEQNTLDHETRLFLSFDSPHLGANVPIGFQYLFNYMLNGDPGVMAVEALVDDLLNSVAAKQMLVDHYLGHVDGGGINQAAGATLPIGAPNFRDAFQTEIDAMGFPQNTRNVAIINGGGDGASDMTGTPGFTVIDDNIDTSAITSADITVRFAPSATLTNTVTDFVGYITVVPVLFYSATAESPAFTDGVDSAPGGLFQIDDLAEGGDQIITDFVNALNINAFDFIPTVSGLSLATDNGEINWYHDVDLGEGDPPGETMSPNNTIDSTPFVNWFIPENNESHVLLTQGNVTFALAEIMPETLSVPTEDEGLLKLEKNPIRSELVLLNSTNLQNANLTITDLTGKQVFKKEVALSSRTTIPLTINSGLYVLTIEGDYNMIRTFKLVVR